MCDILTSTAATTTTSSSATTADCAPVQLPPPHLAARHRRQPGQEQHIHHGRHAVVVSPGSGSAPRMLPRQGPETKRPATGTPATGHLTCHRERSQPGTGGLRGDGQRDGSRCRPCSTQLTSGVTSSTMVAGSPSTGWPHGQWYRPGIMYSREKDWVAGYPPNRRATTR